ncbi:Tm-1-like ATP-binding domain-containing protein [Emcibacter nanhaiensis]|uniref:UPF0261 family protein n=1 Tax=Emcibacter nanhaiensis TaxID=1505037 RepID=A0A501PB02_9PROT|nr:Tm-1-like ATP-binding domain-containing protein [Emcibacter nanhaiensis]TPD57368.1 UPF0261 family protein [Emcibacter nanhaiensis]
MSKPRVLLIIPQDTKQQEARFAREILEEAGCEVVHLDPSVRKTLGGAEISPEQIAAAAGTTIEQVRAIGHEGKIQDVMIEGSLKMAHAADEQAPLSGILSIGGSMGTSLSTKIMRSFPYGLPKVMVSTIASGFTAPYVGVKDIVMMYSVTDISGLNSINSEVYRNAALGISAMAKGYTPTTGSDKPLVLITTLGTTEPAAKRIRDALVEDGCEVMIFHSSGAGGPTLDSIAAERDVALVLDMSVTEMVDYLFDGLANAGPERGKAGLARGIPTIVVPGNADFIIGGPIDEAKAKYPGKKAYHIHNAAMTAVRTTLEDLKKIGDHLAAMMAEAKGPVRLFVPLHGLSSHDSPEGHLYDPSLPPPFADYLKTVITDNVTMEAVDAHINDVAFSDEIIAAAREMMRNSK